jgi:hypothetical protein
MRLYRGRQETAEFGQESGGGMHGKLVFPAIRL